MPCPRRSATSSLGKRFLQRPHGHRCQRAESLVSSSAMHRYPQHIAHQGAVVSACLAPPNAVLVGHSLGASGALAAAVSRPDLVHGLLLFEPICPSPKVFATWVNALRDHPRAKVALQRQSTYNSCVVLARPVLGRSFIACVLFVLFSVAEARAALLSMPGFKRFHPDALAGYGWADLNDTQCRSLNDQCCAGRYLDGGFESTRSGGIQLCCRVENEARFLNGLNGDGAALCSRVPKSCRTHVVSASGTDVRLSLPRSDGSNVESFRDVSTEIAGASFTEVTGSHNYPMVSVAQSPRACSPRLLSTRFAPSAVVGKMAQEQPEQFSRLVRELISDVVAE